PNKYSEGIYVVPPVASSIVFLMMYSFFSIPEFFYNANKFSSVASTISAIINIGLNYVGIIMFGYIAAGYTTMLCYMLLAVGHFLYAKKIVTQRGLPFFDDKQTYGIMALMVVITIVSSILYRFVVIRGCIIAVLIIGLIVKRRNIINLIKNIKS
ncbi:polysaccharide biosynthesis C-terminal domain-containing protein, partial [uncultured Anaerovibrio sp.]|uniref:polysaccharide biosynthesis C-terminal domain-containing protein n=1 Tax=uncultured Anaerovibrio sp. TaxID=361586 RepID=UPI00262C11E2